MASVLLYLILTIVIVVIIERCYKLIWLKCLRNSRRVAENLDERKLKTSSTMCAMSRCLHKYELSGSIQFSWQHSSPAGMWLHKLTDVYFEEQKVFAKNQSKRFFIECFHFSTSVCWIIFVSAFFLFFFWDSIFDIQLTNALSVWNCLIAETKFVLKFTESTPFTPWHCKIHWGGSRDFLL